MKANASAKLQMGHRMKGFAEVRWRLHTRVDPGTYEGGVQGIGYELDALGHGSRDDGGCGDGKLRDTNGCSLK